MADTIPCPACGTDNSPDAVRCHVCDYELRVQLPGPPSGSSKCPRCGSGIAAGASFCQVCGQSVERRFARPHTGALNVRALFGDEDSVPQRVPIRERTEIAPSAHSNHPAAPYVQATTPAPHAGGYPYDPQRDSGPQDVDPSAPRGRRRPAPRPRPTYSGFDAGDSSPDRARGGTAAPVQPQHHADGPSRPTAPPRPQAHAAPATLNRGLDAGNGGLDASFDPGFDPGASGSNLPRPRPRAKANAEPLYTEARPRRGHDEAAAAVAYPAHQAHHQQGWGSPAPVSHVRLVLVGRDGREGESFPLPHTGVEIGRNGPISFPSDPFVSPHHAKVTPIDGGIHLADLGSRNGVYLRLTEPTPVYPGDFFLLGNQLLRLDRLETPWQEQPLDQHEVRGFGSPVKPPWAVLVRVCVGEIEGDRYHLRGSEMTIGREQGEIVFPSDGFLSRAHARIRMDVQDNAMNVMLEDLGSANGTYLRVRGAINVPHGAMFRVGDQIFRVRHD